MTQTITIGVGARVWVVRIPEGWDAFVLDGRIYVRAAGGFVRANVAT